MRQLSSRLFAFCSKCVFPLSACPSLPFAHFHLPLVGDAANQPPPHSDPVHHVRVIRGHASSGEPPQRHCLQLRPRADQRHGTTHRHTHTHKKKTHKLSHALSAPVASKEPRVPSVRVELYNRKSGFFNFTLKTLVRLTSDLFSLVPR